MQLYEQEPSLALIAFFPPEVLGNPFSGEAGYCNRTDGNRTTERPARIRSDEIAAEVVKSAELEKGELSLQNLLLGAHKGNGASGQSLYEASAKGDQKGKGD